jgi:hypothetical protein
MGIQQISIVNIKKLMNLRHNKPSFTYAEPELPKTVPRVRRDPFIHQSAQLLIKLVNAANSKWRSYQREYSPARSDSPSSNHTHNPSHWEELTEAAESVSYREQLQTDWENNPKDTTTTLQNMGVLCQHEPQLTPILERMKK